MNAMSLQETHAVSAKLMAGEEADAIANAACTDNESIAIEDHGSYLTISGSVSPIQHRRPSNPNQAICIRKGCHADLDL